MGLILIAAVAENGMIGFQGKIPWYFSEDIQRFRKLTTRNTVIMGRKTYDSLPSKFKPLPERNNIVVTRNEHFNDDGIITAHSIEEALTKATSLSKENYVIGGAQIYKDTIDLADTLEITHIVGKPHGDAFFPEIDIQIWKESLRIPRRHYDFVTYKKHT